MLPSIFRCFSFQSLSREKGRELCSEMRWKLLRKNLSARWRARESCTQQLKRHLLTEHVVKASVYEIFQLHLHKLSWKASLTFCKQWKLAHVVAWKADLLRTSNTQTIKAMLSVQKMFPECACCKTPLNSQLLQITFKAVWCESFPFFLITCQKQTCERKKGKTNFPTVNNSSFAKRVVAS